MDETNVDSSKSESEQFVLYEGDGVEVLFKDGGRLQLSPCGTIFVYQRMSTLSAGTPIQQKTQFATSSYRQRVKEAVDFRNRFAQSAFLCRELIEVECVIRSPMDIFECYWPTAVNSESLCVLNDGSVKLSSTTKAGSEPVAIVWLSATGRTFIVRYLAKLKHNHGNNRQQNTLESFDRSESVRETNLPVESTTHVLNQSSLGKLRRVIDFDDSDEKQTLADDSKYRCTLNTDVPYLEYAWVSQHYSISSYPVCWVHPVHLLLQFCKSSTLSSCAVGLQQLSANKSSLPVVMSLRCPSPHLHRWNLSSSDDVCDYFHDKVKIIAIKGTIYRLLWDCTPRLVEVYPPDGSIVQSTGETGHHFTHFFFSSRTQQVEERTYSSLSPPPLSTDLQYSVSRLVVMAHRLFELMSDKYLNLAANRQVCWQVASSSCPNASSVIPSDHIIDECSVEGVGYFTAYLNGNIHIVFHDRTCLDMHGISWESHVYQKILRTLSSDNHLETFMSNIKMNKRPVDFPDDVCRLLLPSGHYQHVDVLRPHPLYERYVSSAMEYAMWVNTPLHQRQTFYCDSLTQQKHVAHVELKKIHTFTYIIDKVLGLPSPPAGTSSLPLSIACSPTAVMSDVQSVAQQALNDNAEILKGIDSFLSANDRNTP